MRGAAELTLLLALLCGGCALGQARRLADQCSDLSILYEELPQASDILRVIEELGVFRGGITPGTTMLLPSNEAAASLPQDLQLPFKLDTLASAMPALGPEVKWRIVSTIMYHVSTVGALNGTQLAQRGDLPTVLEGASLLATDNQPVSAWAVTDGSGRKALPVAGPSPTALETCGAAVYVIDTAMLPAPELYAVPKTTVAQAVDALAVVKVEALAAQAQAEAQALAAAAAAAPAPAPADDAAVVGEAAPAPAA
ncbi:50S ribosomal L25 [Chlorella sorokiniana]|uniref:50S ribosomal L25 n=1 Tax=Chlorella sorokiniana TaxID=3076 RepID=A0A2P6TNN8_CHLSO|nr:50S ribosomal L25 [Chlorella sorokiniana]|eukprot:PRW50933.1 50S ribosomal L25 [Chlorella sorokiniana]